MSIVQGEKWLSHRNMTLFRILVLLSHAVNTSNIEIVSFLLAGEFILTQESVIPISPHYGSEQPKTKTYILSQLLKQLTHLLAPLCFLPLHTLQRPFVHLLAESVPSK